MNNDFILWNKVKEKKVDINEAILHKGKYYSANGKDLIYLEKIYKTNLFDSNNEMLFEEDVIRYNNLSYKICRYKDSFKLDKIYNENGTITKQYSINDMEVLTDEIANKSIKLYCALDGLENYTLNNTQLSELELKVKKQILFSNKFLEKIMKDFNFNENEAREQIILLEKEFDRMLINS